MEDNHRIVASDVAEMTTRARTTQRHDKHHAQTIEVQYDNVKETKNNPHQHIAKELIRQYIMIQKGMAENTMHQTTRKSYSLG